MKGSLCCRSRCRRRTSHGLPFCTCGRTPWLGRWSAPPPPCAAPPPCSSPLQAPALRRCCTVRTVLTSLRFSSRTWEYRHLESVRTAELQNTTWSSLSGQIVLKGIHVLESCRRDRTLMKSQRSDSCQFNLSLSCNNLGLRRTLWSCLTCCLLLCDLRRPGIAIQERARTRQWVAAWYLR